MERLMQLLGVGPKLSLSERLERVYEEIGMTNKKIDEILASQGLTSRSTLIYKELMESFKEVRDIQFPRTVEDYEKIRTFLEKSEILREELNLTESIQKSTFEKLESYSSLSDFARFFSSYLSSFPRHVRTQNGIEIVRCCVTSPFDSIKIYEIEGNRPTIDKLPKTLEKYGFGLRKAIGNEITGMIAFLMCGFYTTEEGILIAYPFAYPKKTKTPRIYLCRGPRDYATDGMVALLPIFEPDDKKNHEYVYTENFSFFTYDIESKIIEELRDLFRE